MGGVLLVFLACAPALGVGPSSVDGGVETGDSADEAVVTDVGDIDCDDAPRLSWASFGHAFLLENCQGCHAAAAPDRYGAPAGSTFDTVDDAWRQADRILARAWADDATMPPLGGVDASERTRLGWWLVCGVEGT